jgi:signal peptidase I
MEHRDPRVRTTAAVAAGLAAALALKLFCFDIMAAEGNSMAPTIPPGSILLVHRLAYGFRLPLSETYALRWGYPKKGDILVFLSPLGEMAVKRCAGDAPGGMFEALGDNSGESYDSRSYGPVSTDLIFGKVIGYK